MTRAARARPGRRRWSTGRATRRREREAQPAAGAAGRATRAERLRSSPRSDCERLVARGCRSRRAGRRRRPGRRRRSPAPGRMATPPATASDDGGEGEQAAHRRRIVPTSRAARAPGAPLRHDCDAAPAGTMPPVSWGLTRRSFLAGAAAGAGAVLLGRDPTRLAAQGRRSSLPLIRGARFAQGVASGQQRARTAARCGPSSTGSSARSACRSRSAATRTSARCSTARTSPPTPSAGFAVHHRAEHPVLAPGRAVLLPLLHVRRELARSAASAPRARPTRRSRCASGSSPARRSRRASTPPHAGLANEPDLDLVVCLGDYIYERLVLRGPAHRTRCGNVQTLDEYRRKYALYHTDQRLLEVRRQFPMIAIWDDHEVEDNYAARRAGHRDAPTPSGASPFAAAQGGRLPRVLRAHAAHPRARGARPHVRLDPARRARRAVPARPAPVPRRPAVRRRVLRARAPSPRSPGARCSARAQKAWFKDGAGGLARVVEGRRQPGDDHVARRPAAERDQQGPVGRLRRRARRRSSSTSPRRGVEGRHVHHRRHPHVLRRRRHATGRAGLADRPAAGGDGVRRRRDHLAGDPAAGRRREPGGAARSSARCCPNNPHIKYSNFRDQAATRVVEATARPS